MSKNTIFAFPIYTCGVQRLISDINYMVGKIHIISGNAEVLKAPLNDEHIYELFSGKENIIIPDGISVYYPLKKKDRNCRRIPGIELMQKLLVEFEKSNKSVYFLGAKESVINQLIANIRIIYPHLRIAGYYHGYFDKDNCTYILDDIKQSQAFALFVALGTPSQENFIFKYMEELPCTILWGLAVHLMYFRVI
jgi:N-acetylglucosaminyldiphosphoundecaprenol N-acetyl-beta-D-mannosaminyltransferase